jgi:LuxR family maltose regulon positive regulatory protein
MGIELPPALKTEAAAPAIASPQSDGDLTTRELDVLRLLADGLGNQIIAEKLFVSVTTVRTHLRNINIKLDAHNRTEAIAIARRRAIIP